MQQSSQMPEMKSLVPNTNASNECMTSCPDCGWGGPSSQTFIVGEDAWSEEYCPCCLNHRLSAVEFEKLPGQGPGGMLTPLTLIVYAVGISAAIIVYML